MPAPMDAFDEVRPAADCLDLLTAPVAAAIRAWRGSVPVEQLLFVDTDPAIADTALLVERHGSWLLEQSANCVVVAGMPYALIGSGSRRGKLIVPGKALAELPGAVVLDGLGTVPGQ